MIIVTLTFKKPMPEIFAKLDEHNVFLDDFFAKNKFLASGLLEDKSGGIILVMSDSIEEAQNIMKADPFYIHDLVNFDYTFFAATKLSPNLQLK